MLFSASIPTYIYIYMYVCVCIYIYMYRDDQETTVTLILGSMYFRNGVAEVYVIKYCGPPGVIEPYNP